MRTHAWLMRTVIWLQISLSGPAGCLSGWHRRQACLHCLCISLRVVAAVVCGPQAAAIASCGVDAFAIAFIISRAPWREEAEEEAAEEEDMSGRRRFSPSPDLLALVVALVLLWPLSPVAALPLLPYHQTTGGGAGGRWWWWCGRTVVVVRADGGGAGGGCGRCRCVHV